MPKSIMIQTLEQTTSSGLPRPSGWSLLSVQAEGRIWKHGLSGVVVVEDTFERQDGLLWLHISIRSTTGNRKLPPYEMIHPVRLAFIGRERESYLIFPPESRRVQDFAIHLFSCISRPSGILPAFEFEDSGKLRL